MKQRLEHTFNKILLAGNQPIYLKGLAQMLLRIGAAMRISQAANQNELNVFFQKEKTLDLAILVSPLIRNSNNSILSKIYKINGNCQVILMADDHELPLVFSFVKEGVKAAVSKSCAEGQIIQALNSVNKNSFYFSPMFAESVINKGLNTLKLKGKMKLIQMSEREKEIIRLMWNDYTSKEISDLLKVSLRTIETHRNNIYDKLNVKTLGGIFKYGLENGIIS